MHDIKAIRANPAAFDASLSRRSPRLYESQAERLLGLDNTVREDVTRAQATRSEIGAISAKVGEARRAGEDATQWIAKSQEYGQRLIQLEDDERNSKNALRDALSRLPNLPHPDVPEGASEIANREIEELRYGTPRRDIVPSHHEIGARLGMMHPELAVAMSGQRFNMLTGVLAQMERALGNVMLDIAFEQGYTEVSPPLIVHSDAMYGTGQLPKFGEDIYWVGEGDLASTQCLIPTGEVPLTNIVRETIIPDLSVPHRYSALTPCFRAEAGAAGRDATGIIRQHQFYKVELVTICKPDQSENEHNRMLFAARMVLEALKIPYRVVELCCGDLGFSAQRTVDIEVWFPSQQQYREISSISNCGDFQARRMNARYRDEKGKPAFVHTLNGSGVAVGRCLAAIMENYWQADRLMIPDILQPRMRGKRWIALA